MHEEGPLSDYREKDGSETNYGFQLSTAENLMEVRINSSTGTSNYFF